VARAIGAEVTIEEAGRAAEVKPPGGAGSTDLPIRYRGQPMGHVACCGGDAGRSVAQAAAGIASVCEHALDREMAVDDLAGAMTTSYEELHMLYTLLSEIAIRTDAAQIGELLVDETARTLNCGRVSLLVFDEQRENLRILAARGLPLEAEAACIRPSECLAGRVLGDDGLLVVDDISARPDLAALSRGKYHSDSFAIIRVPLNARGEAVGVLTATERLGAEEFTTRDRKLFEGISSIGASALLNCRLHSRVNRQMMSTIQALASAVDAKDHYTHDHSGRVAQLCVATAQQLGITDPTIRREVRLAGLLHDIGKIGIPDVILAKTEQLTPDEYVTIKAHVEIGAEIVEHVQGFERVAKAILHHHERYDGLGYPNGLAGSAIPLLSKLISAADVFDTLTSNRPYRVAMPAEEAVKELRRCKGTQQDPDVVEALITVVRRERESPDGAKNQPTQVC
jgi:putative nucleotidyltransferase with HDIG domain